eukprot:16256_1
MAKSNAQFLKSKKSFVTIDWPYSNLGSELKPRFNSIGLTLGKKVHWKLTQDGIYSNAILVQIGDIIVEQWPFNGIKIILQDFLYNIEGPKQRHLTFRNANNITVQQIHPKNYRQSHSNFQSWNHQTSGKSETLQEIKDDNNHKWNQLKFKHPIQLLKNTIDYQRYITHIEPISNIVNTNDTNKFDNKVNKIECVECIKEIVKNNVNGNNTNNDKEKNNECESKVNNEVIILYNKGELKQWTCDMCDTMNDITKVNCTLCNYSHKKEKNIELNDVNALSSSDMSCSESDDDINDIKNFINLCNLRPFKHISDL